MELPEGIINVKVKRDEYGTDLTIGFVSDDYAELASGYFVEILNLEGMAGPITDITLHTSMCDDRSELIIEAMPDEAKARELAEKIAAALKRRHPPRLRLITH